MRFVVNARSAEKRFRGSVLARDSRGSILKEAELLNVFWGTNLWLHTFILDELRSLYIWRCNLTDKIHLIRLCLNEKQ